MVALYFLSTHISWVMSVVPIYSSGNVAYYVYVLNRYWSVEMKRKELGRKARLWIVIFKCIWFRFLVVGFLLISEVCIVHIAMNSVNVHLVR